MSSECSVVYIDAYESLDDGPVSDFMKNLSLTGNCDYIYNLCRIRRKLFKEVAVSHTNLNDGDRIHRILQGVASTEDIERADEIVSKHRDKIREEIIAGIRQNVLIDHRAFM